MTAWLLTVDPIVLLLGATSVCSVLIGIYFWKVDHWGAPTGEANIVFLLTTLLLVGALAAIALTRHTASHLYGFVGFAWVVSVGAMLQTRLKEQAAVSVAEDVVTGRVERSDIALYLRPFFADSTISSVARLEEPLDELLARHLRQQGLHLIAVGHTDGGGASRFATSDTDWEEVIVRLMRVSKLIVIWPSVRRGTAREIDLAIADHTPKLTFLTPSAAALARMSLELRADYLAGKKRIQDSGVPLVEENDRWRIVRADRRAPQSWVFSVPASFDRAYSEEERSAMRDWPASFGLPIRERPKTRAPTQILPRSLRRRQVAVLRGLD